MDPGSLADFSRLNEDFLAGPWPEFLALLFLDFDLPLGVSVSLRVLVFSTSGVSFPGRMMDGTEEG